MNSRTSCRWSWAALVLLLGLLSTLIAPNTLSAQAGDDLEDAGGTTYVIAFPDTTTNTQDARFAARDRHFDDRIFIFIYSAVDNQARITGLGYQNNVSLRAGHFEVVDLNDQTHTAPQPITTESGAAVTSSFRIESDHPIVVYQFILTIFGTEAWTPLPVQSWGTEYYAAMLPAETANDVTPGGEFDYNKTPKMAPSEITIVAAYDNTKVNIVPNGALHNFPATSNVTLMKDQVYQVQSYVDTSIYAETQPDLGGSYVFATKPIGVYSGNTRAMVRKFAEGLGENSFKNMLMEALAPVEQHGTEFVYMPTWDSRRPTGAPNEDPSDKRKGEIVRVYGTHSGPTGGTWVDNTNTSGTPFTISDKGKLHEDFIGTPVARRYRTDQPAQAMMNTIAVVKFGGTTGGYGGYVGAQYDGWGAYMVEMTPREQWPSFAPFYAPLQPPGMEHFINVVTDTNNQYNIMLGSGGSESPFVFNRGRINGTDLVWGTMNVPQGVDNYLRGKDSAKFYAFCYGLYKGHEEYRPGRTKKKDDGKDVATLGNGGDDGDPHLLHPSEYEEWLGVSYGYPLAPIRLVVGPGDSLKIDTVMGCFDLTIDIQALNQNPVGLRDIHLEDNVNAKISNIDPQPVTGASKATVVVSPIDRSKDASATVVIKDRTGKVTRVYYKYEAEYITFDPADSLDFGIMQPGQVLTKTVTVTNPLNKDLEVTQARLADGLQDFSIDDIQPPLPLTLKSGESVVITIKASPQRPERSYEDSLYVKLGCSEYGIKLKMTTGRPIIWVYDVDFGVVGVGIDTTKMMKIENQSQAAGSELTFTPGGPNSEYVFEFFGDTADFEMTPADKQTLMNTTLGPGESIELPVTFHARAVGTYEAHARVFANTRDKRDTSIWRAVVTQPGPQLTGKDWGDQWVVKPNECTKNPKTQYLDTIFVSNTGNNDFTVTSFQILPGPDASAFELDTTGGSNTKVLPGDNILHVVPPNAPTLYPQVVLFRPTEERAYSATVQLVAFDALSNTHDTVERKLIGVGIETHISTSDLAFDTASYVDPMPPVTKQVIITNDNATMASSRPLTITDLQIANEQPDAGHFTVAPATRAQLPVTLGVGETFPVDIIFQPQSPGYKTADLLVFGDHDRCISDSVGALSAYTFTYTAEVTSADLGDLLNCFNTSGTVTLTNTGSATIIVEPPTLGGPNPSSFSVDLMGFPDTLKAGESVDVPVTILRTNGLTGNQAAQLSFRILDEFGNEIPILSPLVSNLSGNSRTVLVPAHIPNDISVYPGKALSLPVLLDGSLDEAKITSFTLELDYGTGCMRFDSLDLTGTLLEGWSYTIGTRDPATGLVRVTFTAPNGQTLQGTDKPLVQLAFDTFIGDSTQSTVDFTMTLINALCADVQETPGLVKIEGVCGLNFRLIEAYSSKYALNSATPNPFNPTTTINFSLGLDGYTRLVIYDASGRQVATLVDGNLDPGSYQVTWDATSYPSGLYYYRLTSGSWSKTETMMLTK